MHETTKPRTLSRLQVLARDRAALRSKIRRTEVACETLRSLLGADGERAYDLAAPTLAALDADVGVNLAERDGVLDARLAERLVVLAKRYRP